MIRKKKKYHDGASGSEYEYEYDSKGNMIGKTKTKEGLKAKKHVTRDKFDKDDGNYFEKVSLDIWYFSKVTEATTIEMRLMKPAENLVKVVAVVIICYYKNLFLK